MTDANAPQRYDAPRASSVTRQDVKDLGENPECQVLAADSAQESRYFLGKIIAEIQIYTRTAIICYTLPLPGDSPLAGMRRQEVDLPDGGARLKEDGGATPRGERRAACSPSWASSFPGDGTKKTNFRHLRCHPDVQPLRDKPYK